MSKLKAADSIYCHIVQCKYTLYSYMLHNKNSLDAKLVSIL